ncbi:hypothetical protein BaRGS_00033142, partial [Batillaria attramentaria]
MRPPDKPIEPTAVLIVREFDQSPLIKDTINVEGRVWLPIGQSVHWFDMSSTATPIQQA